MALRFIHSKDRTRSIRAEMTDTLHEVVWFGHLPYGSMPENDVDAVDMDEAEAIAWVKAERAKPSPPTAPYDNPFALK